MSEQHRPQSPPQRTSLQAEERRSRSPINPPAPLLRWIRRPPSTPAHEQPKPCPPSLWARSPDPCKQTQMGRDSPANQTPLERKDACTKRIHVSVPTRCCIALSHTSAASVRGAVASLRRAIYIASLLKQLHVTLSSRVERIHTALQWKESTPGQNKSA